MAGITHNSIIKLLASISFLMLLVAMLLAWNNPAKGYELDIYASTPTLTWVFIGLALVGGVSIIIQQAVTKEYNIRQSWILGLLVLITSRFCLLYIPHIRNYYTWQYDNVSHIGDIKDILTTGHISINNFYPISHIYTSQFCLLTGIPEVIAANLHTAVISVLFVLGSYLLASVVFKDKRYQLLAVAIAGSVYITDYNVLYMPNGWSIFFLTFLFYLFLRYVNNSKYVIPFLFFLIIYPFFHPLSSLIVATTLPVVAWFPYLSKYISRGNYELGIRNSNHVISVSILEWIMLLVWIFSFRVFKGQIVSVWNQLTSGGLDTLDNISNTLSKLNLQGFDVIVLFFKLYGTTFILLILAILGFITLLGQVRNKDYKCFDSIYNSGSFGLFGFFFFTGFLYLLYLLGLPGMHNIGGSRILNYAEIFTPVLASISLYLLFNANKYKWIRLSFGSLIVLTSIVCGYLELFSSPYTIQPNLQVTRHDISGTEWLVYKKDANLNIWFITTPLYRYADAVLGGSEARTRNDLSNKETILSDHFGYHENIVLGEQYNESIYLDISQQDRIIYNTIWKEVGRFLDNDFLKLEEDITASKLYDNGEFTIYYIVPFTSQ